jgi:hypothetical protein
MATEKPLCPARDEFTEADLQRHRVLQRQVDDEHTQALTPSECGELSELRARWGRYLGWRAKVDAYFDDVAKEASRPPSAADPTNAVAVAMRERRQGYRHAAADREASTTEATSAAHGHSDPLPSAGRRTPGTGVDRLARAVADNAARLEQNRLKPIGFVW